MIEIVFPDDGSERLAWLTAVVVMMIGLGLMVVPRRFAYFLGLIMRGDSNNGVSELRAAMGGVWAGLGFACIILAQPFTYFALGMALAFAVIGRLVSFVFDRSFSLHCILATVFEAICCFFVLKFAFEALGLI